MNPASELLTGEKSAKEMLDHYLFIPPRQRLPVDSSPSPGPVPDAGAPPHLCVEKAAGSPMARRSPRGAASGQAMAHRFSRGAEIGHRLLGAA